MSVALLSAALRRLGIEGQVESVDGIAVLTTSTPEFFADSDCRASAMALAREQGFGSLAVEIALPQGALFHRD